MALTEKLTAIADAIREKTGEVAALSLEAMVEAINGIETNNGGCEDAVLTITNNRAQTAYFLEIEDGAYKETLISKSAGAMDFPVKVGHQYVFRTIGYDYDSSSQTDSYSFSVKTDGVIYKKLSYSGYQSKTGTYRLYNIIYVIQITDTTASITIGSSGVMN